MPEVHCKVSVVGQEAFKVVLRCIVEGVAGCAAKLRNNVLQLLFFELGLSLEDLFLRRRQYAVNAAQHREREDDVLVLAAFESVADQVRDTPDETDLFSEIVHPNSRKIRSTRDRGADVLPLQHSPGCYIAANYYLCCLLSSLPGSRGNDMA